MRKPAASAGYFRHGLSYNRFGHGRHPLVNFQGLVFEHKPQSRLATWTYNFLGSDYTVFSGVELCPQLLSIWIQCPEKLIDNRIGML